MTVTCLSTGAVRSKRGERGARRYLPGGWGDDTLPVNVFLVEHPQGLCLFDAGQTARAALPGHFPRWYPFFWLARFELGPEDEVAPQLRRLGVDPGAVRWVVLSHLHTDHVGGLASFAAAQVVVARTEWQRATGLGGRLRGYLPQYWPAGLEPTPVDFTDGPVGPFPASHHLVDDGTLVLVPTPGHTPGHMALLARVGATRWLLCGDVAHTAAELAGAAPQVAAFCRSEGVLPLTAHDDRATDILATGTW
jgi:glyoxylase-like metal-dependent hydrolase (beta-lactamase superfamily II)